MPSEAAIEVSASFADAREAAAAAAALVEAGIPTSSIDLRHGVLPEAHTREGEFVRRVLGIIVLWSIAGALPGAAFGWLLAVTIGPEGTAGLVVQLVCWIIVGHLIGGMLAGYFVLADRSQREMPPDRPVSLLTVQGLEPREGKRFRRLLRSHHPLEVRLGGPSDS